ncbi:MAG: class I SAM-dependent methyltransferase [Candidatus Rokubacteria bacterium]|nr:class I SAM-dependent methyltransferase [Candidatus Rokubacteria bacterium]
MSTTAEGSALARLWNAYAGGRETAGEELARLVSAYAGISDWRGLRVLDLGCGDGGVGEALRRRGARVTGLDVAPGRVQAAVRRGLAVVGGDGHRLPFAAAGFDLVVLYDVLEHVRRPAEVLREVAAVLRPGGCAYVTVPNRLSPVNMLADPHYNVPLVGVLPRRLGAWCVARLLRLAPDYTVERYFTWWEVTRLFRRAGFDWHEAPAGYAAKLASGAPPNAPSRRWMGRLARRPVVRAVLVRAVDTRPFRRLIAPAWRFLLRKPPRRGEPPGA